MRSNKIILASCLLLAVTARSQTLPDKETITRYFKEFEVSCLKKYNLWNRNLYGPLMLINEKNRQLFANEPDSFGILALDETIYSGKLPGNVNISNTALEWVGKIWATVILQHVPDSRPERINFFAHESFHREQTALGFTNGTEINNHLDQKEGRIFLRLELEALKKSLQSSSSKETKKHLMAAIVFRQYRHRIYQDSDTTENTLELNEGMAEYTGIMFSGRSDKQTRIINSPSFVRSFPYYTIPIYGYLLYQRKPNWGLQITSQTDLTNYFIKTYAIDLPPDPAMTVAQIARTSFKGVEGFKPF